MHDERSTGMGSHPRTGTTASEDGAPAAWNGAPADQPSGLHHQPWPARAGGAGRGCKTSPRSRLGGPRHFARAASRHAGGPQRHARTYVAQPGDLFSIRLVSATSSRQSAWIIIKRAKEKNIGNELQTDFVPSEGNPLGVRGSVHRSVLYEAARMTGQHVLGNLGLSVLARSGSTRTHQRCLLLGNNPDRICSL